MVLLQNNGALPFAKKIASVLLIGKASQTYAQQAVAGGVVVGKPMGAGGGSSDVVPHYTVSPREGLKNTLAGLDSLSAEISLVLIEDDNSNLSDAIDRAISADAVIIMAGSIAEEGADRATFDDETGLNQAVSLGDDLDWYTDLPNKITSIPRTDGGKLNKEKNSQTIAMIKAIMNSSPDMAAKTALVLKDNAGIALPDDPLILGTKGPAIVEAWFPGQEDGNIVADVLFGVVNPSGKLPVTFPIDGLGFLDHIGTDPSYFPGVPVDGKGTVTYKEGLNIGYRWYDANVSGKCTVDSDGRNPCIAFPFGFGLSYTRFEVSEPTIDAYENGIEVTIKVTNIGERAGAEVIQVYLGIPSAGQPPKRLVAFEKVHLNAGEGQLLTIAIDADAAHHPFSVYDKFQERFVEAEGEFEVYIGTSSSPSDLQSLVLTR